MKQQQNNSRTTAEQPTGTYQRQQNAVQQGALFGNGDRKPLVFHAHRPQQVQQFIGFQSVGRDAGVQLEGIVRQGIENIAL